MIKALFFVLLGLGIGAGALYWTNPDTALKTFDEFKTNAVKFVENITSSTK